MATPSGFPSTINPKTTHQSPHIIPSDEESISYQSSLPPSIDIYCLPKSLTKTRLTETSDATLHKNYVERLYIFTLNIVHRYSINLHPIPSSSTLSPCENRTYFESLNLHRIFGCRKFCNKNHITAATNASLVNSGLLS